jgi:hypothetical protein
MGTSYTVSNLGVTPARKTEKDISTRAKALARASVAKAVFDSSLYYLGADVFSAAERLEMQ